MDQTLPLALAPAISNPYLKYPDSGHAEDRQPECCCFVPIRDSRTMNGSDDQMKRRAAIANRPL
jgi:hypothetical protein